MKKRDYEAIAGRIRSEIGAFKPDAVSSETTEKSGDSGDSGLSEGEFVDGATLRIVVNALWDGLKDLGVSWVGFYRFHPGKPERQAMTLGPSRDTPACSPIGLHGVCGQALSRRRTMIVRNVEELGEGYVACDPRDRSEIVLPCFEGGEKDSPCWGVLDLDSHEVGAFDESDAHGLVLVLEAAGVATLS